RDGVDRGSRRPAAISRAEASPGAPRTQEGRRRGAGGGAARMNLNVNEVLIKPLITEKNTKLGQLNKYTFKIDPRANKTQVKDAVQSIFKVEVTKVNVISVPGKMRRVGKSMGMSSPWKKAVVTVRDGQRIEIFEGV